MVLVSDGAGFGGFEGNALLTSLLVVQVVIQMHLVKGMTSNTASIGVEEAIFGAEKAESVPSGSLAIALSWLGGPVSDLDAVADCRYQWIRKPLPGLMLRQVTY